MEGRPLVNKTEQARQPMTEKTRCENRHFWKFFYEEGGFYILCDFCGTGKYEDDAINELINMQDLVDTQATQITDACKIMAGIYDEGYGNDDESAIDAYMRLVKYENWD